MRRFRAFAVAAAIIAAATPAGAADATSGLEILGKVTNAARPVADALVIAFNLEDLGAIQTFTSSDGSFSLAPLRAGIYKIIAVKQGFAPTITTLVPTGTRNRVALRLRTEKTASRNRTQEIWELRASLPPDVLRSLDGVLQQTAALPSETRRFRGEIASLTGVTGTAAPTFAQTALGVEGRIGDGWSVGVRGNMQRIDDPTDDVSFGDAVAESSAMSMELRTGDQQSYRVASTRSSWLYAGGLDAGREADVVAHNFEWNNGPATVRVRYFEQDNLFRDLPLGSNLIEVSGNVPVFQTTRTDLGVAVRVMQETVETHQSTFRRADLTANGSVDLVPSFVLHYGLASRIGIDGQEWAPRAGAEWRLSDQTSFIGSVLMKVSDREMEGVLLPSIVFWSEDANGIPRYSYTFAFVSGEEANRFTAAASVTEVDESMHVVLADAQARFWDAMLVDAGDVRRDVRVSYRRQLGDTFAFDVATSAGTASPADASARSKVYVTGDLQSTFRPTGTTLAVSYRDVKQPREGEEDYRAERINVHMAQSLYLPLDIKLLLGLELARAENSPYMVDALMAEGQSKKYIGGLALNF